ncbi:hypothetical protein PGTUg99_023589 [Puccinia graminis f. sp. tritici]|uniref:Uncharacterized protein n=1 Tax=Puccinia graminis f. sp. tritici TaxID=56615 RepID=A0A5B0RKT4_PUCGR|nr:hypothetical protein PGTUg99_023589 [Puccinia graminis f. sp. tritici]
MASSCWIAEMIILALSMLDTTCSGPTHLPSSSDFAMQLAEGYASHHSILKRPSSGQKYHKTDIGILPDGQSYDKVEECVKRPKLDIKFSTPAALLPPSCNMNDLHQLNFHCFKPEGESMTHYAWIAALVSSWSQKKMDRLSDHPPESALIYPNESPRKLLHDAFVSSDNFVNSMSKFHSIHLDRIINGMNVVFEGLCYMSTIFMSTFQDTTSDLAKAEQQQIFLRFMPFLRDLNTIAGSDVEKPHDLPTCFKLVIEYLKSDEDHAHAEIDSNSNSDQMFWKVKKYSNGPFGLISTPQTIKTHLIVHFLGSYYKSLNEAKWNLIFSEDLSFVKLFAKLKAIEINRKMLSTFKRNYQKWGADGSNIIFPWIDKLKCTDAAALSENHNIIVSSLAMWDMSEYIHNSPAFSFNLDLNKDSSLESSSVPIE